MDNLGVYPSQVYWCRRIQMLCNRSKSGLLQLQTVQLFIQTGELFLRKRQQKKYLRMIMCTMIVLNKVENVGLSQMRNEIMLSQRMRSPFVGQNALNLTLVEQLQFPPLLLDLSLLFLFLSVPPFIGQGSVVVIGCFFHLGKPVMLVGFELGPVSGVLQELLVEHVISGFDVLLDLFFLPHLLIQVFPLQFLILLGTLLVGMVLSNQERNSRAVLCLFLAGVWPKICLFGSFHSAYSVTLLLSGLASSIIIKQSGIQKYKLTQMSKTEVSSVNKWLEKDRSVWIKAMPQYPNPDEDAFLEGKVLQIHDKQILLELKESDTKIKVPIEHVLKLTYGPNDVSDMVDLQQLNEPELLYNIKRRYINDLIFTYCGPTLVIVNPYAYIDKLFNDLELQKYQTMVFTDNLEYKSLNPHIFALAAFCLWQLFDNYRSQSIVISGESGAGKTQNTKSCLKFLASLGRNMKQLLESSRNKKANYENMRNVEKTLKRTNSKVFGIEEKILGCNEILEAFGNAKTIRNDNSSRFGKLILLVYGETQIDIKSAFIISYLLEKSRIVSVSDGERNYHIFYLFCKGTNAEEKKQYLLNDAISAYYYLNQSTVYDLPKSSDSEKFLEIKKQFGIYLIPEETDCVYRVLSIVLNVGNVLFKKGENKNNQQMVTIINQEYLKNVAQLLEVEYDKIKHCFQFKTRKTGVSIINSPLKYDEALALRDSFSKNIYEKVFNFLVSKLNEKIQIEKIDFEANSRQARKSIGLLDIFGFQVLLINSLQQFFINFANQKLQQLYVSYIFKEEQNEFLKQGLKEFSHDIGFQDNKTIIDLFESYPLGIFHLINESSQLNKPDQNLPETITKNHKNPVITIPKSKKGHFQISHSCSPVSYNTAGFTSKNKDEFPKQLLEVIKTTKNEHLRKIVVGDQKQEDTKGKKPSSKFLGSKFLAEMNKLIEELYSCDCHFVRCIKPNSKKAPKLFNSEAVLQSLRYLGVLDSIKIRKLGYIYRRPYKQFFKKFYQIQRYIFSYPFEIQGKSEDDFKQQCRKILQKIAKKQLQEKDILFGSKKILIKESALNHLELLTKQKRRQRIQSANKAKRMYKNALFRVQVKHLNQRIATLKTAMRNVVAKARQSILNKKIIRVQHVIRKYLWHLRLEKIKEQATKSVTKISAYLKMKKQRKWFLNLRTSLINIQSNIRLYLQMKKFQKEKSCQSIIKSIFMKCWSIIQNKKALIIQKNWKGYKVRKAFKQILKVMKIRAFIKRAIIKFRVHSFMCMLQLYKKPIIKLQAIVRTRYIRHTYLKIKKSTIVIQKAYRRHLHKRFYLQKIWEKERRLLEQTEVEKYKQLFKIGFPIANTNRFQQSVKQTVYDTSSQVQRLSPSEVKSYLKPNFQEEPRDMRINQTIYFPDKNTFQAYLLDVDIISTLTYKGHWSTKYANLKSDLARRQQYPLKIQISQSFTCVVSNKQRVYSFGEHAAGEENEFSRTELKGSPHCLQANDESVYVVTKQYDLYEWGDNKNGELFLQTQQKTVRLNYTSSVTSAKDVQARGPNRFYVDYEGKAYQKNGPEGPKLIQLGPKVQVAYIVASYSFTHFLTSTGHLYSMGSNANGQLGIETAKPEATEPVLNEYFLFKKQAIETVSVGLGHTIVRSKLGYVYGWGDNRYGQICCLPQTSDFIRSPIPLQMDKTKMKVLQAVAGLRASYLLLQSLAVVGLGTSNGIDSIRTQSCVSLDLLNSTNSNPKNLVALKISCSWNRQMSVLVVNCLEQNKCKGGTKPDVVLRYCKLIAKDWMEKLIYPQYAEWMDNILNIADMRKFKFSTSRVPNHKQNPPKGQDSDLEELKILMDLRKTSTLFKTAARNKIQHLLRNLACKPIQDWTKHDEEISNYIKEYCKVLLS